jgi:hypothetical protein
LGKRVGTVVRGYNEAVASFEARVLPSARKMAELGTVASTEHLPTVEPVTRIPRELRARELDAALALEAGGCTDEAGQIAHDGPQEDQRDVPTADEAA